EDSALTGQVTVAYEVADDVLTYATYSRGAKSGGLSLGVLPAGVSPVAEPEKVDAWELGVKSQFWDRRGTLNAAAYWTEVDNSQAAICEQMRTTRSFRRSISTTPGARSRGVGVDRTVAPTRNARLTASAAYHDAVHTDYTNAQAAPENRNGSQIQYLSG